MLAEIIWRLAKYIHTEKCVEIILIIIIIIIRAQWVWER